MPDRSSSIVLNDPPSTWQPISTVSVQRCAPVGQPSASHIYGATALCDAGWGAGRASTVPPPPPPSGHPRTARRNPRRQSGGRVKQLASLQFSKHLLLPPLHRCRLLCDLLILLLLLLLCDLLLLRLRRVLLLLKLALVTALPPSRAMSKFKKTPEVRPPPRRCRWRHSRCTPRARPTTRCVLPRNLLALVFLTKTARAWVVLPPALLWRRACAANHQREVLRQTAEEAAKSSGRGRVQPRRWRR